MFIAHLPAGYLMAHALSGRRVMEVLSFRALLLVSMSGAVAPDMDLLYFFFMDDRQHNHHGYFTHYPLIWGLLLLAAWSGWRCLYSKTLLLLAVFAGNGLVHLLLDTVVGEIAWLAPWSMERASIWQVEARFQPWWLNFLLHPSFLLELLITATAGAVAWWSRGFRRFSARGSADRAR